MVFCGPCRGGPSETGTTGRGTLWERVGRRVEEVRGPETGDGRGGPSENYGGAGVG